MRPGFFLLFSQLSLRNLRLDFFKNQHTSVDKVKLLAENCFIRK